MYQLGARKATVFGIGPLGCSPLARARNPTQPGECLVVGNQLALGFNAGVKQLVGALLVALPDFHIVFVNTYDPLVALMADGDVFGKLFTTTFKNNTMTLELAIKQPNVVKSPDTLPKWDFERIQLTFMVSTLRFGPYANTCYFPSVSMLQ